MIASGLKAGDQAVIDGVDRLRDGAKYKVVDNPPPPEAAAAGGHGHEPGGARQAADPPPSPTSEGQYHRHSPGAQAGDAADACAAGLAAEAKAIYDAAAPEFAASADPRALVKAKVVDLVKAGAVQRDSARSSATAAGGCLAQLSSASGAPAQGAAQ